MHPEKCTMPKRLQEEIVLRSKTSGKSLHLILLEIKSPAARKSILFVFLTQDFPN
jgi:hypothetical protein